MVDIRADRAAANGIGRSFRVSAMNSSTFGFLEDQKVCKSCFVDDLGSCDGKGKRRKWVTESVGHGSM